MYNTDDMGHNSLLVIPRDGLANLLKFFLLFFNTAWVLKRRAQVILSCWHICYVQLHLCGFHFDYLSKVFFVLFA